MTTKDEIGRVPWGWKGWLLFLPLYLYIFASGVIRSEGGGPVYVLTVGVVLLYIMIVIARGVWKWRYGDRVAAAQPAG